MTLKDKLTTYMKEAGRGPTVLDPNGKYTLRSYDGFDNIWIDVIKDVDLETALTKWLECTDNGTKKTKYSDIDYYAIFPADSKMLHS